MPRVHPATAALIAATLLTAGCATGGGASTGGATADDTTWTTSTDPVAARGLVWASGTRVRLADGTVIDAGGPMRTYVVAGDGVYFTPAGSQDDTDHGNMTTGPLRFADRDGTVTDTGLTVYAESLGSSPDGRYLGVIDATSGPKDDFSDQPQATAVVVDLTTGTRVVDTTDGMGDPAEDDLARDYPEVDLGVRFPDDASAYIVGLDEILYSLPSGEGERVDPIDSPVRSPLDRTSPDGAWAIDDRGRVDVLLSADGERRRPRTGTATWELGWWLDDDTVLGFAVTGPGPARSVMTCEVPAGTCRTVPATAGALVRFPEDTSPNDSVDLAGGSS